MTFGTTGRPTAHSLKAFAEEIDDLAAQHQTTRAEILRAVIAGLEARIAEDAAVLALARQLESAEGAPAGTALDAAIEIVARGQGQRPWLGK